MDTQRRNVDAQLIGGVASVSGIIFRCVLSLYNFRSHFTFCPALATLFSAYKLSLVLRTASNIYCLWKC